MLRALSLGACLSLLVGAAALAQEAIPTAGGVNPNSAPKSTVAPRELGDPEQFSSDDYGPRMGPCGPLQTADGKPDKSAHGEIHAGVGTHGYRNIGGAVCKPIGENGAVAIAVDINKGDYSYGRRYR
jgi:hypothetical protein